VGVGKKKKFVLATGKKWGEKKKENKKKQQCPKNRIGTGDPQPRGKSKHVGARGGGTPKKESNVHPREGKVESRAAGG